MSREIKFRAWSKKANRYLKITGIKYDGDEITGVFVVYGTIAGIPNTIFIESDDVVVLEQYTGLKDKNGKEIYEGDIVNLEYYEKPFGKKRWNKTYPRKGGKDINIVGFEDGYFKFYEEDKDGYGSELAFSDYGEWGGKDGKYKYVAEVIGNIHENPELLGGEE